MADMAQKNLFESGVQATGPVECLGLTFENDDARREHFLAILRKKLKDPEFRKIEGFPIGEDEDILALSDPPYYTACPNPFLGDFIQCYGKPYDPETDDYHREPFAADVSEGKNDPIYNAHSYHTKVPHKAIMRYILHYTEPGDIVFDGFCGTGMTGIASYLCGDQKSIEELNLKINDKDEIVDENGNVVSNFGNRLTILNDLSPAASLISRNYNFSRDLISFENAANNLLNQLSDKCSWMYQTCHNGWPSSERKNPPSENLKLHSTTPGTINYIIWSDVFICSHCAKEIIYWNAAKRPENASVNSTFKCPNCDGENTKSNTERARRTFFDTVQKSPRDIAYQVPVFIDYTFGGQRFHKYSDKFDFELLEKIDAIDLSGFECPADIVPDGFNLSQPKESHLVKFAYDFYSKRNLVVLSLLWKELKSLGFPSALTMWFTSTHAWATRLNRLLVSNFFLKRGGVIGQTLSGTLYISSTGIETNVLERLRLRITSVPFGVNSDGNAIECCSSTDFQRLSKNSIDYVFIDPPFGGNIMYSDVNFLWESWMKLRTATETEAIVNPRQNKKFEDYVRLMKLSFNEIFRVLKPGRWMTVEFHNSKNSIWNGIQEALTDSGFVVSDVRVLEKKHNSFKQVTSTNAVKKDLVITAYKPSEDTEKIFSIDSGDQENVWKFANTHLEKLPIFVSQNGQAEVLSERQNFMLFDRMVAFYIQRRVSVPLSASEFYAGLKQRFPQRDGMYFLPEQIAEYDRKRMTVKEVLQLDLFVNDESTAVQWLRQQLTKKPQTFQELHPGFLKAIGGWAKHETTLELSDLLGGNFLRYDSGNIPKQIVSWLAKSSVHRAAITKVLGQEAGVKTQETEEDDGQTAKLLDLVPDTGLETRDAGLLAAAKDRWYIPDPNKAGDLEKLREKALLKEFEEYRTTTKKLKVFRMEAMRAGFKHYFQQREYKIIIQVARKVPDTVLQEDPKLLMFYDNAVTRAGEE